MGQRSKTTVDQRGVDYFFAKRTISYLLLFLGCPPILVAIRLQHRYCRICLQRVQPKSEVTDWLQEAGADHSSLSPSKKNKQNTWRDGNRESDERLRDLPEWLDEFTDNMVDTVFAPAHISHDSDSERPMKEASTSWMHSVYTLFPKDRNCEICQRTKITRAPCRKRNGGVVHRAEKFGDLITADHKVLSEGCGSRNNHRYAVVVQDSATQWIQSYPCKTKTSRETRRSLQKFLEPNRKRQVIYTDNSLEFGKARGDLSWNHYTSHRSQTNGIAERAARRKKEGTSAVLLQSGLDEKWWADALECKTYLRNIQEILSDGKKLHTRDVLGSHLKGQLFHFVHWLSRNLQLLKAR